MVRGHFDKRANPYAGADKQRSAKLASALRVFGALLACVALPITPPDQAIGAVGWGISGVLILGSIASAIRTWRARDDVSHDELLAYSYVTLAGLTTMEWLAGGRASAYHQIFMLTMFNVALAHPARRFAAFIPFYLAAVIAPFAYGPWTASEAANAVVQTLITLGAALAGSVLMQSVRDQSVAMKEQGAQDRHEAETDSLTGLGNRRALMADLERRATLATADRPLMLTLFDLDGFKAYNDAFGHPAGDAVLARLAQRLRHALGSDGRAYRMGGDEFCVLAAVPPARAMELIEAAAEALSDEGDGFSIGASRGTALLPADTPEAQQALRIADTRMYARKNLGRTSAGRQSTDVLMSVLEAADPFSGGQASEVADMCVAVGRELGVDDGELPGLRSAGTLHDIGKLSIPDAILSKPGPLTDDEWEFVRSHTVIGERILRSAPALASVAPIVRSVHEHFDGGGYPDAIAGEQIPLASRIVAVCDAFSAMASDRPYRAAMSEECALEELRTCAGSQFDPMVVDAFVRVLRRERARLSA